MLLLLQLQNLRIFPSLISFSSDRQSYDSDLQHDTDLTEADNLDHTLATSSEKNVGRDPHSEEISANEISQ